MLLQGPDPGRALSAREALERVAAEDVARVAGPARAALGAGPPGGTGAPPPAPPPPEPPIQTGEPGKPPSPSPPPPPPSGNWWSQPGHRRLVAIAAIAAIAVVAIVAAGGESEAETFQVGGELRGLAVGSGTWIVSRDSRKVTRIDSSSNQHEIEVGRYPGRVAAGEGFVWVGFELGEKLARINPKTGRILDEVAIGEACECKIDELQISDGKLWLSSEDKQTGVGKITELDAETGDFRGESGPLRGFDGQFALNGDVVWAIGNDPESWLSRIDLAANEEEPEFTVRGSDFVGVAYGDERVWIADKATNHVLSFEPSSEKKEKLTIRSTLYGGNLAFGDDSILAWDPTAGILTQIDAESGQISEQTVPGFSENEADWETNILHSEVVAGNEFVWLTNPARNTVQKRGY